MGAENKKVIDKGSTNFKTFEVKDVGRVEAKIAKAVVGDEEKMAVIMELFGWVNSTVIGNDLLLKVLNEMDSPKSTVICKLGEGAKLGNILGGNSKAFKELMKSGKMEKLIYVGNEFDWIWRMINIAVSVITSGKIEFITVDTMDDAWNQVTRGKKISPEMETSEPKASFPSNDEVSS